MNKREFLDLVSAKTGLTKKDSEQTMDALFEVLGGNFVPGRPADCQRLRYF